MGYAIVGGIGLAVGIGLLIWGLIERGKRAKAELRVRDLEHLLDVEKVNHVATQRWGESLKDTIVKQEGQIDQLRNLVELTRSRLVACQDPRTIKAWIDDELSKKEL